MVSQAIEEGARVLAGGSPPKGELFRKGAFYTPTILDGLTNSSRTAQTEIFGPVLCILRFKDEADLILQANDSVYGLACGIWSRDFQKAWRVARRIQAGTVWINTYRQNSVSTPFGGFKQSGLGRERGVQGLRPSRLRASSLARVPPRSASIASQGIREEIRRMNKAAISLTKLNRFPVINLNIKPCLVTRRAVS